MTEHPAGGIYDALVTETVAARCRSAVEAGLRAERRPAPAGRLPELVGRLVADWVRRELSSLKPEQQADAVHRLTLVLAAELTKGMRPDDVLVHPPELLRSVSGPGPEPAPPFPLTPLSDTTLLTNAPGEPNVGAEITQELASADHVDVLMAFVRWTGIRLHLEELERLIERGGTVRVLTTTYTGSTEQLALDKLVAAGAEVKVSYNTQSTRLHAKSWLFRRNSGFSTGLVGSSNLTHWAQVTGMEWNVRVSSVTTPGVVDRIDATFESYWNSAEFEPYDPVDFAARTERASFEDNRIDISHFDITPHAFQQRILDQLELERLEFGRWRNLVVAATGTGKTVMAALDYRRLRDQLSGSRLLFVAHRKEILEQSRSTFRGVLREGAFGELWSGGRRPTEWRHVFASIQSINRSSQSELRPDQFDIVIVDEFHHAAAESYRSLLDHLEPQVLLGLTATPERADGLPIAHWFDGHFAAELRLWDALDEGLLAPFQYFGVHDDVDLSTVGWRAGGYVPSELENVYTGDTVRAGKVLQALDRIVADPKQMRALGFCVTVAHAEFMAQQFNKAGIRSVAVSGQTPMAQRDRALAELQSGEIQAVFSRDVFNEGVDLPNVDTVMLLRPTESATIYLQQLGRGLRKAEGKDVLTVLDFIGQHRTEYRFDQRFQKLLKGSRTDVIKQVESDFPFLPAGCHIELDRVSKEIVLGNLKAALPNKWKEKVGELRRQAAEQAEAPTLASYLTGAGLELGDVYGGGRGWTSLRRAVDLIDPELTEDEEQLQRAVGRMLHVDDLHRLRTWRTALRSPRPPDLAAESEPIRRLLYMLHGSLWGASAESVDQGFEKLWRNAPIIDELLQVIDVRLDALDHRHDQIALDTDADNPLRTHARYSRDEILAAFGLGYPAKVPQLREGVKWLADVQTDLFMVTLNKGHADYSPTTLYKDYAVSRDLFHWESQSMTTERSETGQRYINQRSNGSNVMLFVRERKQHDGRTMPYLCLGLADYVQHRGERPIAITYKLRQPMPPDFYAEAKAVAG